MTSPCNNYAKFLTSILDIVTLSSTRYLGQIARVYDQSLPVISGLW